MRSYNRWDIALAGVFMQVALGAVYAWSVFRVPLARVPVRFAGSRGEIPGSDSVTVLGSQSVAISV